MDSFQYKIGIWIDEFKNKFQNNPNMAESLPTIGTKIFKNEALDAEENQMIGTFIMELIQLNAIIRNNEASYSNFINFMTDID